MTRYISRVFEVFEFGIVGRLFTVSNVIARIKCHRPRLVPIVHFFSFDEGVNKQLAKERQVIP